MVHHQVMRIGMVAGEASGDILGAGLIQSLQAKAANQGVVLEFEGIGGPLMQALGFHSLFPMERLSVMGLVEPLKRLPELLGIRRSLKRHFLAKQPDIFVGIDSPDFNLGLETDLRDAGVKTVHYVSPSVWAWRQRRIKTVARAVDLMLTLLPFEADFYTKHEVPVRFVGHPLADQIPMADQRVTARQKLGLSEADLVLAVLPGSRDGEVKELAPVFLDTVDWLQHHFPELKSIIPAANASRRSQLDMLLSGRTTPVQVLDGQSQDVMAAADAVLMASGTTSLEAMLLKRPMVVAYKMGGVSYAILSKLVKTPFIALPNLLAGEALVPELLQADVRPEAMGILLKEYLVGGAGTDALKQRFAHMHGHIARNASASAADAIFELIGSETFGEPRG